MSRADFANKEYRDTFAREYVSGTIATQLKVLREDRHLTQAQLAEKAGMKQSRISAMEDVNYSSWNIKTLQRLSEALDVALVVRFGTFGEVLAESAKAGREALALPSYAEDPAFAEGSLMTNYFDAIFSGAGNDTSYTISSTGSAQLLSYDETDEKFVLADLPEWAMTTPWIAEVA